MTSTLEHNKSLPVHLDDIHDVLHVMREKESRTYARDFDTDELMAIWRRLLIEWMFFVVDHCSLQRQSVGAAAFFLDIAMSRGLIQTREEHQLAAATALQLSLKTFDSAVIKLDKLVKLGRGLFTEDDVVRMEYKILVSLNWHLHPPSTYCFLRQYERLLPSSISKTTRDMIDEVTQVVAELTVSDHKYNKIPPSVVAYSAILMAMELIDHSDFPVHQRQCFISNMSTTAKLESDSTEVLKAFEDLKQTLDTSAKLQDLIDSLSSTAQRAKSEDELDNRSNSKSNPTSTHSPRNVMARMESS